MPWEPKSQNWEGPQTHKARAATVPTYSRRKAVPPTLLLGLLLTPSPDIFLSFH